MVNDAREQKAGYVTLSLQGLSSDTKPTGTYNGKKIANGSTFLEMDTMSVFMYDEQNERWVG